MNLMHLMAHLYRRVADDPELSLHSRIYPLVIMALTIAMLVLMAQNGPLMP